MDPKVADFLEYLAREKGYSANTAAAYRNDLSQFVAFVQERLGTGGDLWPRVTKDLVIQYIDHMRDREYASSSVARKVAAIKSFFHFLTAEKVLAKDPTATLDSPKVKKRLPVALSYEEVNRLLAQPSQETGEKAVRDRAILELLYATGMQVTEVVSLDVDDVNLASASVRVARPRRRERVIPIHDRAVKALEEYLQQARIQLLRDPDEKALFLNHRGQRLTRQGLWLIIKQYVRKAGISAHVTPHTLRHSFATHLLDSKADLRQVQELLGHANISTTQVYAQVAGKDLRETYDEAHPRAK
ncbi:MAG: site-specific tyrosine recombinase XerD [Anaerolineae bacterium]